MSDTKQAVIISAVRTPTGKFQGALKGFTAPELGAAAIKAAVEKAGVKGEDINEVIMGCVVQAGIGQAPARQAALKAGLPPEVSALTINMVCGSGLRAVAMAGQAIQLGDAEDSGRGRNGIDVEHSLCDAGRARRLPDGKSNRGRSDGPRRIVVPV